MALFGGSTVLVSWGVGVQLEAKAAQFVIAMAFWAFWFLWVCLFLVGGLLRNRSCFASPEGWKEREASQPKDVLSNLFWGLVLEVLGKRPRDTHLLISWG